ncbi:MAG: class I adenylate-forming enzyme family protein [Legionellaceae bacterium]|nr:class I adenylate-forming enzyme family protein [Legionellaceae bacterium]
MLYQDILVKSAEQYPSDIAIIFEDKTLSYQELKQQVDIVAENLWKLGVRPGGCISTFLGNNLENLIITFACFKLGAVSVPIRSQLQAPHIRHIFADARPTIILTSPKLAPELKKAIGCEISAGQVRCFLTGDSSEQLDWCGSFADLQIPSDGDFSSAIEVENSDFATALYTSGSTGNPKGAIHDHGQWLGNAALGAKNFNRGDVTYFALSMNHCYGLGEQILPCLLQGATIIMCAEFKPEKLVAAATSGIELFGKTYLASSFYGVPSMYHAIAKSISSVGHHNLRYLDVAGDILSSVVKDKIRALFGPILRPSYGMTEAMCVSVLSPMLPDGDPRSIGVPQPGLTFKIIKSDGSDAQIGESGELCIQGPFLCRAYLNSNKLSENTIGGYFRTGDTVTMDAAGQFIYVNRTKRIIITAGGYNLNPRDIESVLEAHELVSQSCAFDIQDATGQLLIVALASLSVKEDSISAKMLFDLFAAIEEQHRPSIVSTVNDFRLGSTGKINWQFYQLEKEEEFRLPLENSHDYYDSRNLS